MANEKNIMTSPNTHNSSNTSDDGTTISSFGTLITHATNTTHEGGYDYELVDGTDSRYECPICLLCLRDPVLTTCGHRFCSGCISQWVIKENGKCPVDSVSLSHENIFPDNYTRREIMGRMAKCPYSKDKANCTVILPLIEMERHVQSEHLFPNSPGAVGNSNSGGMNGTGSSPSTTNGLMECPYKEVGCAIPLRQEQLSRHLEMDVHHHLQLLTAAYKRLKIYSSRGNLIEMGGMAHPPDYLRTDSRDSTRWLLEDEDDYQFRRQRSWDSVRFARKHNHMRPSTSRQGHLGSGFPLSEESLCQQHSNSSEKGEGDQCSSATGECKKDQLDKGQSLSLPHGTASAAGRGADPHFQDIFQRLVLLEQKDREKQIKIDKLEAELASVVKLSGTSTQIIKDFTARYCHGIYVWKIPNFRKLCSDMRRNPNRVLNSPGFYTDTFGYKLCLRFNLTTPSSGGGAGGGLCGSVPVPVDVPLEQDEDTFISLYVHFMMGEFDDTLHWPFHGEMKLIVIHPSIPEDSVTEVMYSKPEAAAFAKPTLGRSIKGFGYPEFCPVNKIFANGFVKEDTLVCKVLAKSNLC